MMRIAMPGASTCTAAVPGLPHGLRALLPLLLVAGCASWRPALPIPSDFIETGVAGRVLIPPDLNVNPPETVVKPGTPRQAAASPPAPPVSMLSGRSSRCRTPSPSPCGTTPGCGRPAPPSSGRGARRKRPFPPSCRKSTSWGNTASPRPLWPPAYPAPRGSSWRTASGRAATRKPKWRCSGPCTTSGGPAAATARPSLVKPSPSSSSPGPARPWSSTWPPLTWTSFWPVRPGGCKKTLSAGPGDPGRHRGPAQGRRCAQGGRAARPGAVVGEPRGPGRGPGRRVQRGSPPEQRHGTQRRFAAGSDRPGGTATLARGAGRPPGAGRQRAAGGRPGPASRWRPPRRAGTQSGANSCRGSSSGASQDIPTAKT